LILSESSTVKTYSLLKPVGPEDGVNSVRKFNFIGLKNHTF